MRWLTCDLRGKERHSMSVYLIAAYAVFLGGMLGLALSIWLRQRWTEREIARLGAQIATNDEAHSP
jgi:hypothetical protein